MSIVDMQASLQRQEKLLFELSEKVKEISESSWKNSTVEKPAYVLPPPAATIEELELLSCSDDIVRFNENMNFVICRVLAVLSELQ